ncbi:MAG: DUF3108 domain-containing protein [Acidobacteriota bacterium]
MTPFKTAGLVLGFVSLLASSAPVGAADPAPPAPEVLHYVWRLEGFGGRLASLFVPGDGNGTLSTGIGPSGKLQSELMITSDSRSGEFWRYGAELDPATHATVRAWSSYHFRDKSGSKDLPVAEPGAVDISSAIYLIRQMPPKQPMPMRIWTDGRLYPVRVVPSGLERASLRVPGDGTRERVVRRYVIEGVEQPGERFWKGHLEIVLSEDAVHTPIEIAVKVSLASLRLRLVDGVERSAGN